MENPVPTVNQPIPEATPAPTPAPTSVEAAPIMPTAATQAAQPEMVNPTPPSTKAKKLPIIMAGVVIALAILAGLGWYFLRSTDNMLTGNNNSLTASNLSEEELTGQPQSDSTVVGSDEDIDYMGGMDPSMFDQSALDETGVMNQAAGAGNKQSTLCYSLILPNNESADKITENSCRQYLNLGYDAAQNYLGSVNIEPDTHSYASLAEMVADKIAKLGPSDQAATPFDIALDGVPAKLVIVTSPTNNSTRMEIIYVYLPNKYVWSNMPVGGFEISKVIDVTDPALTAASEKAWAELQASWKWL